MAASVRTVRCVRRVSAVASVPSVPWHWRHWRNVRTRCNNNEKGWSSIFSSSYNGSSCSCSLQLLLLLLYLIVNIREYYDSLVTVVVLVAFCRPFVFCFLLCFVFFDDAPDTEAAWLEIRSIVSFLLHLSMAMMLLNIYIQCLFCLFVCFAWAVASASVWLRFDSYIHEFVHLCFCFLSFSQWMLFPRPNPRYDPLMYENVIVAAVAVRFYYILLPCLPCKPTC